MDFAQSYPVTTTFAGCELPPVASAPTMQTGYRPRQYGQTFTGEKFSGGLNYETAFNLDRNALRLRSIRAYEESTQARAAINRLNESVINTGLTLQSTPESSLLDVAPDALQIAAEQIETRFKLWSSDKGCDRSGNNTLGQIERIEFNNQLIKGDYFAYLHFSDDPDLINPLQIQLILPERVETPYGTDHIEAAKRRGNRIIDGIEFGQHDEEVAYYVKVRKPDGMGHDYVVIPRIGKDTGRVVMIHGNRQRFGNEPRGIPALGHIAHELEKITDFSIMELTAAAANASIAAIVTPSADAPASNPMPTNTFIPPSLVANVPNNNVSTDHGYTNIGKNVLQNGGGMLISSLNAGEKYESFDTKRPNVNFGAFVQDVTKYLSASLSIPIEVLTMEFGKSYSASRASLLLFWQSLNVWRDEFVSDFCTPVYQSWLLGEVGNGSLILPGFDNPHTRAAWQSAKWIGIPLPSIDPLKEERAADLKFKNGLANREEDSQTRHNSSFRNNIARLKRENIALAEANEPLIPQEAQ